ncbi:methionyl-tRNA formyltransferase [Tissierella creatinophila]|uniref:Methionyl-tRNA formyltransferase n=1 Tax=Tissierella creatinophila DSM 6911 TaxID=1123403 RepID=A0A1U7M3D3_TISCR|nr:methionyl-tRNA formyltransferase [Tissierella creatinophila]OLS01708.1 methionyl-tRNA formyltransferase [Tissierella creatinophila DSM 6911]
MSKTKIVFMGTPDFAVKSLEALYKDDYDIKLVITQRDKKRGRGKKIQYTPVKQKALDLGLQVYQPEDINTPEIVNLLKDIAPDFIVVVAFGQILKKEILDIPKYKCINVHASLLPKYRGAAPINWAIIDGEKETGITIMEMEKGLDTGDMISKASIPIDTKDDYISIHDKLSSLGGELLTRTLKDIKTGKAQITPQDDSLSSYAPMIYKMTGKIDWNSSGRHIVNLIRGVVPWPVAFTSYKGENLKIYKAELTDRINKEKSGMIVKVSDEGLFINCDDSTLIVKELQFPNKKRMQVKDYLKGNTIEVGTILE